MERTRNTWRGPETHGEDLKHIDRTRNTWRGPETHGENQKHMERI